MKTILTLIFLSLSYPSFAGKLFFEKDSALPLVNISVVFKGGSAMDPLLRTGVTQLMIENLMRGTTSRSKSQIDTQLDKLGATLDAVVRTEFVALKGAVLKENLIPFLDLVADILSHPSFRVTELDKSRRELISELQNMMNQDAKLASVRFDSAFFGSHPFGRFTRGRLSDLTRIQPKDIKDQFEKVIQNGNMLVLANGDAQESDFESFLTQMKRNRPSPDFSSPFTLPEVSISKSKIFIFDKPDRTQTQIVIGHRGIPMVTQDREALEVANDIFGGSGFGSRILQELRVKRGWTYGAGSQFKYASLPHSWRMSFFPKSRDTASAIKVALDLFKDFHQKGVTLEEFQKSKTSMLQSAAFQTNTSEKRLEIRMVETLYGLPDRYIQDSYQRLEKVTYEETQAAIQTHFHPDQLVIGIVATAKTIVPDLVKTLGVNEKEIVVVPYTQEDLSAKTQNQGKSH